MEARAPRPGLILLQVVACTAVWQKPALRHKVDQIRRIAVTEVHKQTANATQQLSISALQSPTARVEEVRSLALAQSETDAEQGPEFVFAHKYLEAAPLPIVILFFTIVWGLAIFFLSALVSACALWLGVAGSRSSKKKLAGGCDSRESSRLLGGKEETTSTSMPQASELHEDPERSKANKVQVQVSSSASKICNIRVSDKLFDADLWIDMRYDDPVVKRNHAKYRSGSTLDPEEKDTHLSCNETPMFHLVNNTFPHTVFDEGITVEVPATGTVLLRFRLFGTFKIQHAALADFPFDSYRCPVELCFDDRFQVLPLDRKRAREPNRVLDKEFFCQEEEDLTTTKTACDGKRCTFYTATSLVTRDSQNVLLNCAFPTSMLSLLCLSALSMEVGDIYGRMAVVLTLLLTQTALQIALASVVPKPPQSSAFDKFGLAQMILTAFVGVESFVAKIIQSRRELVAPFNTACTLVFMIAYAITHVPLLMGWLREMSIRNKANALKQQAA